MSKPDPVREFARLKEREDIEIDLAEAALWIARTEYPALDITSQLKRLDRLAAQVSAGPMLPPLANIQALNDLLFERENFSGNDEEYDDPRNSYLNQVLDRKKGIPITLSLVYAEVAGRRGLPIVGVGFPGHFLVKYLTGTGEILIDPYNRGLILSQEDCFERLKAQFGEEAELRAEVLAASTRRQILLRMLNNLKASYFRRRNYPKVLTMIELSMAMGSDSVEEVRDRGLVYVAMARYGKGLKDLEAYLRGTPPDDPQAKEVLKAVHRVRGLLN